MEYMTHALIGWFFAWHFVFIFFCNEGHISSYKDFIIMYQEVKSIFAKSTFSIYYWRTVRLILAQCVIMIFGFKGHFNL